MSASEISPILRMIKTEGICGAATYYMNISDNERKIQIIKQAIEGSFDDHLYFAERVATAMISSLSRKPDQLALLKRVYVLRGEVLRKQGFCNYMKVVEDYKAAGAHFKLAEYCREVAPRRLNASRGKKSKYFWRLAVDHYCQFLGLPFPTNAPEFEGRVRVIHQVERPEDIKVQVVLALSHFGDILSDKELYKSGKIQRLSSRCHAAAEAVKLTLQAVRSERDKVMIMKLYHAACEALKNVDQLDVRTKGFYTKCLTAIVQDFKGKPGFEEHYDLGQGILDLL